MALRIIFLALSFLYCRTNALSQQANIGLWSDSGCNSKSGATSNFGEPDPIALNFTLSPDVCGVPGATVHSYRVLSNATCANGTIASFNFFNSNNCTADPTDEDPNPGLPRRTNDRRDDDPRLDGECLALIAFNSLAFICEGIAPNSQKVISLSTSSTVLPTPSSLTNSTSSNTSATATSSSTTNTTATSHQSSKASLPASASAGVGVGSAVGVLAIAALLFFCFRRRSTANNKDDNGPLEPLSVSPAMRSATEPGNAAYEAGDSQIHEAGGVAATTVHEVGIDSEIHEMPDRRRNFGQ